MKKIGKKIAAIGAAVMMAVSMMSVSASAVYTSKSSWSASYVYGNANMCYNGSATIHAYGGGYKTYCSSIGGSNNRYIRVKLENSAAIDYNITTTGYSSTHYYNPGGEYVTFKFIPNGTTMCKASGTIGYP